TLPVLTRFFTTHLQEVERKVGGLYALNTFGAAAGSMLAALVLIPGIGNIRTTLLIAGMNVTIGLFAIWLAGGTATAGSPAVDATEKQEGVATTARVTSDRLVLLTLAVSGFVSMLYELSWTRALAAII